MNLKEFFLLFIFYCLFCAQINIPKFEHDFGIIKADMEVSCTFEIGNSEEDPIVVESIEAG